MPNTNCLTGFSCPACDGEGPFLIEAKSTFEMHDDGSSEHKDVEFDIDSPCACSGCGYPGFVRDFRLNTKQLEFEKWAEAIADRIVDESSMDLDEDDAELLRKVLGRVLSQSPASAKRLIGTGVIEESFFDEI